MIQNPLSSIQLMFQANLGHFYSGFHGKTSGCDSLEHERLPMSFTAKQTHPWVNSQSYLFIQWIKTGKEGWPASI